MANAKPFTVPAKSSIRLETVNVVSIGENAEPTPHPYTDFADTVDLTSWWNPGLDLQISLNLTFDLQAVKDQIRMVGKDRLIVGARTYCSATKIQTLAAPVVVTGSTAIVSLTTKRFESAKSLDLRCFVGLQPGDSRSSLPPLYQIPEFGQLWSSSVSFRLTGAYSMMNIRWISSEEDPDFGLSMWKFRFYMLDEISVDEWIDIDASTVIEVHLNEAFRVLIESNEAAYVAMWSELSYAAITKVMGLPDESRTIVLQMLSSKLEGGSWINWLKDQFRQAFSLEGIAFAEYKWASEASDIMPRLQAAKYSRLLSAKKAGK